MSVETVLVCRSLVDQGSGSISCADQQWVSAYLIPPDVAGSFELLTSGGFSPEYFAIGTGSMLLAFAIGFGVGLVINTIRKL